MNSKLIPHVQKFFSLIGIGLLLTAGLTLVVEVVDQIGSQSSDPSLHHFRSQHAFPLLAKTSPIFLWVGQAFLAFLVSNVLGVVARKPRNRPWLAPRLVTASCLGFVGHGIFSGLNWLQSSSDYLPLLMTEPLVSSALLLLSHLVGLLTSLTSFVYALGIYYLHQHFSQMVAFEAEVV